MRRQDRRGLASAVIRGWQAARRQKCWEVIDGDLRASTACCCSASAVMRGADWRLPAAMWKAGQLELEQAIFYPVGRS